MRQRKWEVTAAALVLSATLLAGCSTGNNQAAQAMNVTVKVSQAQKGMLGQGSIYTGTVNPSATVNIMPKIAGKVDNVTVDVGAEVKPGQVLFRLDDDDLRNKLKIAESDAKAAQAGVKTAESSRETGVVSASSGLVSSKNGIISSKSAITQAQSGINQAQAAINQANTAAKQAQTAISTAGNTIKQTQEALATAKSTLTRTQSLADNGLATQAQLEQAQAAVVSAQTAYDNAVNARANAQEQLEAARNAQATAQKGLATAQSAYENANSSYANASEGYNNAQRQLEVSQSTAGVEASQQKVSQAQVNIDIARDALDNAVVKSPINGIVVTKNVEVGEMVSSAAPSLVIANLDTVNILIYVPAEEINGIQAGDRVQVNVASSGIVANGKVKNINPMDAAGNGYPVEVAVTNPGGQLKTGMLADVSFVGDDAKEGIIIPSKAILKDGNQSYVYVAVKGKAVRKPVTVSTVTGSQALVSKGLAAGDRVISNNLALLGDDVTIQVAANS